jgi:hypothetical protein
VVLQVDEVLLAVAALVDLDLLHLKHYLQEVTQQLLAQVEV